MLSYSAYKTDYWKITRAEKVLRLRSACDKRTTKRTERPDTDDRASGRGRDVDGTGVNLLFNFGPEGPRIRVTEVNFEPKFFWLMHPNGLKGKSS